MSVFQIPFSDLSLIKANEKEVMRYLGVLAMDDLTKSLYDACDKHVREVMAPKAIYAIADITVNENAVDFGFMRVESKNLSTNLRLCDRAYVFCATLGTEVDRYFEKLKRISSAKAAVFSAVASSYIESVCDYVNAIIAEGKTVANRFSCGYGDFCLEHQKDILNALEADKKIGVCLTESLMMVPVKTVTAIVGVRR